MRPGRQRARAEVRARAYGASCGEHGDVFARVVGAGEARVAAVICGEQQQVVRAETRQQLAQRAVEGRQRRGVAVLVAAVAEAAVEVHKIDKAKPAKIPFRKRKGFSPCRRRLT